MTPEELKRLLNQSFVELKNLLNQQQTEIKTLHETKDETAQKIAAIEKTIAELQEELVEAAKRSAIPSQKMREETKSVGQRFVESEQYKNFIEQKQRMSAPLEMKSIWTPRGLKYLNTTDQGAFSALPFGSYADRQVESISVRDLMTVVPTTAGSVEYVRSVGFAPIMTHTNAPILALATDIPVDSLNGFVVGENVNVGGEWRVIDSLTPSPGAPVPDLIAVTIGVTAGHDAGALVYQRHMYPTAEGELKPNADWIHLSVETATMRTIATTVDATRQVLDDQTQLQALIDNQLTFELAFSEAWNIINGNGVSPNLNGILNDTDIQTLLWSDGQPGDTKIDTLRRAITLVTVARYPADGIAVNPFDWEDIELAKGSDEHYLWISITQGGQQLFFRLPVAVTEAVSQGTAIVGAWKLGATLYDRESANVRISEEHSDYFKRNMIAVLGEERLALAVNRPEAFVEVTFDSAPAEPPA